MARAVLSDRYKVIDNLDILTAVLTAVRQSGVDVQIAGADLSERRMYLDVHAPAVAALAPVLLGGYRNPFADPATEARRRGAGRTGDVPTGSASPPSRAWATSPAPSQSCLPASGSATRGGSWGAGRRRRRAVVHAGSWAINRGASVNFPSPRGRLHYWKSGYLRHLTDAA